MNNGQLVGAAGWGACLGYAIHEIAVPPANPVAFMAAVIGMAMFGLLVVYSTPRAS